MAEKTRVGGGRGEVARLALALLLWASPPLMAQEGDGCTLTQGFWKNHPSAWPTEELLIGSVIYTQGELIELLELSPEGDASLILAHQLIAAWLNVAIGANTPAAVAAALDAEDAWMAAHKDADGTLPYGVTSGPTQEEALALSEMLYAFNEGNLGPGHCQL